MSANIVPNASVAPITYYDFSAAQRLPILQKQFSFHKEIAQIIFYLIVNQPLDFTLLKQAINIEIARNDCLRIRLAKQEGKWKQYFLPEFKLDDIAILDFTGKTKEEQDEVLSRDARKPLRDKKGEMYRIYFYRTFDGRTGIYLNVNHILMDIHAVVLFYNDLLEIYATLKNGAPMPRPLASYEECLKKDLEIGRDTAKLEKDKQFYKEFFLKDGPTYFAGVDGMRMLNRMRRKKKDPTLRYASGFVLFCDKSENLCLHLPAQRADPILAFCQKHGVTLQTIICMGMRTYLSKINEETDDVYFLTTCNRRVTVADKRSGGCRINALPLRAVIPKNKTFMQALEQLTQIQLQMLRHADYPLMIATETVNKWENRGPFTSTTPLLISCLPFTLTLPEGWKCEMGNYSNGRFAMSLYAIVVPNFTQGGLNFHFEHEVKVLSHDDLTALFEQSIKVIEAGIANPDITIDEILHTVL